MKNNVLRSILLIGSISFMLSGCQKDQSLDQAITIDDQINLLVDQSWNQMADEDLFPENPSLGIEMLNEGISADFLLDETYFQDAPPSNCENQAGWYATRDRSMIRCLRGLQLNEEQQAVIRHNLRIFGVCKKDAVHKAREIYRELRAEYRQMFKRLVAAYRNGTLTEREFKRKVAELRADFRNELHRLHLRERLDLALKKCLREFLREVHGTLTERQWNAFVECYRGT